MRVLVACPECQRQYDAGKLSEGSRFRCLCGAVLRAHRPRPHDASVVRCSACGAPRQGQQASCTFCGADFTLHERDLHTICPACLTRVSDRARFCHHCASPLISSGPAGEPSEQICPTCPGDQRLSSRQVGDPGIGVLECPTCAGLWLSTEELQILLQRVRSRAAHADSESAFEPRSPHRQDRVTQEGPLYRACPVCGKLMHRRNFGRKSGVIVDQCGPHGYWFDDEELDALLRWVRQGGEMRVSRLERQERLEESRSQRLQRQLEPPDSDWPAAARGSGALVDAIGWLLGRILTH